MPSDDMRYDGPWLRMWNLVSEQWIAAESTCEWWNSIEDFAASPRWIPKGNMNLLLLLTLLT